MPNENPKRRPWFQLHLSTCVVLMVVAGLGVWLNVRPQGAYFRALARDPVNGGWSETFTIFPTSYPEIEPCLVYEHGPRDVELKFNDIGALYPWLVASYAEFGWPFVYALNAHEDQTECRLDLTEALLTLPILSPVGSKQWDMGKLVLNVALWATALLATALVMDLALRRRTGKRRREPG